jgi:hypothetical protein
MKTREFKSECVTCEHLKGDEKDRAYCYGECEPHEQEK